MELLLGGRAAAKRRSGCARGPELAKAMMRSEEWSSDFRVTQSRNVGNGLKRMSVQAVMEVNSMTSVLSPFRRRPLAFAISSPKLSFAAQTLPWSRWLKLGKAPDHRGAVGNSHRPPLYGERASVRSPRGIDEVNIISQLRTHILSKVSSPGSGQPEEMDCDRSLRTALSAIA